MIAQRKPSILLKYLGDTLGQMWVIAGGFGGLAGVVVLIILEKLGAVAPIYAEIGRLLIVCAILVTATAKIFIKMDQAQAKLAEANAELHEQIREKEDRKRTLFYRLQANLGSSSFESIDLADFSQRLEKNVLRDILLLYDFVRVSMYVWGTKINQGAVDGLGSDPLEAIGDPLAALEDNGKGIVEVNNEEWLRAEELILAARALTTKDRRATGLTDDRGGRFWVGYVPILDVDDISRVWSVLVVYQLRHTVSDQSDFEQELVDLEKVLRPELAAAFRRAYESELKARDLQKAKEAIAHQHISAMLKRNPSGTVSIDEEFPTPIEQLEYVNHLARKHSDLVSRAFGSSSGENKALMICGEDYSLCLVPLASAGYQVNQVVMSVERSSHPITDDKSRWKALADLVKHLYCGTIDDLCPLHSKHALYRRLDDLLGRSNGIPKAALLLIEVGTRGPLSRKKERSLIPKASKVIEQWSSTLRDDLAMASRLEATLFALLVPAGTEDQAYVTATAIKDQMHRVLDGIMPQLAVSVGIAMIQDDPVLNREVWLDAAYMALECAEEKGDIVVSQVAKATGESPQTDTEQAV